MPVSAEGQAATIASDTSLKSAVSATPNNVLIVEHRRRTIRRFAIDVRHASLHATPAQHIHISRLVFAVRLGHVTVRDAHLAIIALRDQQHPERKAA